MPERKRIITVGDNASSPRPKRRVRFRFSPPARTGQRPPRHSKPGTRVTSEGGRRKFQIICELTEFIYDQNNPIFCGKRLSQSIRVLMIEDGKTSRVDDARVTLRQVSAVVTTPSRWATVCYPNYKLLPRSFRGIIASLASTLRALSKFCASLGAIGDALSQSQSRAEAKAVALPVSGRRRYEYPTSETSDRPSLH